jgi:hypothetical protein
VSAFMDIFLSFSMHLLTFSTYDILPFSHVQISTSE